MCQSKSSFLRHFERNSSGPLNQWTRTGSSKQSADTHFEIRSNLNGESHGIIAGDFHTYVHLWSMHRTLPLGGIRISINDEFGVCGAPLEI